MKDYKQMAADVLARRDQYAAHQKAHRKKMLTVLPCTALVLFTGIGIWHSTAPNSNSPGATSAAPTAVQTEIPTTPAPASPTLSDAPEETSTKLNINWDNVVQISSDYDAIVTDYDDLAPEEWDAVSQAFAAATGFSYDAFVQRISPYLSDDISFYGVSTRIFLDDGPTPYYLHDYVFEVSEDGASNATIAISPLGWPLRCCIVFTDDMKQSWIHGTSVIVVGSGNYFWVRFEHQGAFYDIETLDLSQEDLEALLNSLLAP